MAIYLLRSMKSTLLTCLIGVIVQRSTLLQVTTLITFQRLWQEPILHNCLNRERLKDGSIWVLESGCRFRFHLRPMFGHSVQTWRHWPDDSSYPKAFPVMIWSSPTSNKFSVIFRFSFFQCHQLIANGFAVFQTYLITVACGFKRSSSPQ